MQQNHLVLSLKAMKPNERVLLPDLNTPSPPPPLPPWGVKAVLSGAGSQFTQARQPGDKQLGLNKAFRYKGRATTGYMSCLWRPAAAPGLPVALATPHLHSSIMADRCQAQLGTGIAKCKVCGGKTGKQT